MQKRNFPVLQSKHVVPLLETELTDKIFSTSRKGLNMVTWLLPRRPTSLSKPADKINRTIRSEQVLQAFVEAVRKNLPLELKNTRITSEDIIYALAYANVHRLSIESACQELQGAPSSEVLTEALPDRAGLQRMLNRMFRQQLHPSLWKCKRDFSPAIDLTDFYLVQPLYFFAPKLVLCAQVSITIVKTFLAILASPSTLAQSCD